MTKDELYESLIERLIEENAELRQFLKRAEPMVGMVTCTVNGISYTPIWQKKAEDWLDEVNKKLWTVKEFIPKSEIAEEYEQIKQD